MFIMSNKLCPFVAYKRTSKINNEIIFEFEKKNGMKFYVCMNGDTNHLCKVVANLFLQLHIFCYSLYTNYNT